MFKFIKQGLYDWYCLYVKCKNSQLFGACGANSIVCAPSLITNYKNIFLGNNTIVQSGSKIISYKGRFILRDNSVCSYNITVVTGNHVPTVRVPFISLAAAHVNDTESDVIIDEDVWIGANVTLLAGAHISRGAIVGACTMVNKTIPPYAVVVGCPAKIIASKFTIDQIIKHEKYLYEERKRYTKEYLEKLFSEYYSEKKNIGVDSLSLEDIENLKKIRYKIDVSLY